MLKLKFLYYFSGPDIEMVEIKRLDLVDAPLSDIYKWLVIRKESGEVLQLNFKAMNKSLDVESRDFEEGSLSFNSLEANLELKSYHYSLKVLKPEQVPDWVIQLI